MLLLGMFRPVIPTSRRSEILTICFDNSNSLFSNMSLSAAGCVSSSDEDEDKCGRMGITCGLVDESSTYRTGPKMA